MNQTLTTSQLRLVALLLAVVVLGAGYWLVVAKHSSSSSTAAKSTPASTTPTAPTPSKHHTPTTHTAKLATHGLPVSVARALQKHSVVVVSLYSPQADLDKLSTAEAKAGAAASGVGFVAVNVFHQRAGIPLLHKVGIVDTPAVLVIGRHHAITAEFKGFADRNVVAQAATDAR